jgi:hypothetical protein
MLSFVLPNCAAPGLPLGPRFLVLVVPLTLDADAASADGAASPAFLLRLVLRAACAPAIAPCTRLFVGGECCSGSEQKQPFTMKKIKNIFDTLMSNVDY